MQYQEVFKLAQDKGCTLYSYQMSKNPDGEMFEANQIWCMSLIQKWLRDKHKIEMIIRVGFGYPKWYDWLIPRSEVDDVLSEEDEVYPSYEEALLNGIFTALSLLP